MRNRTRMIAAAAVTAALAAGGTAAVASTTGAKPGVFAKAMSASEKPGHDAMVAAVAGELHLSTARVSAALQPLFAAGHADPSSSASAAAAHSEAPPPPPPGHAPKWRRAGEGVVADAGR